MTFEIKISAWREHSLYLRIGKNSSKASPFSVLAKHVWLFISQLEIVSLVGNVSLRGYFVANVGISIFNNTSQIWCKQKKLIIVQVYFRLRSNLWIGWSQCIIGSHFKWSNWQLPSRFNVRVLWMLYNIYPNWKTDVFEKPNINFYTFVSFTLPTLIRVTFFKCGRTHFIKSSFNINLLNVYLEWLVVIPITIKKDE